MVHYDLKKKNSNNDTDSRVLRRAVHRINAPRAAIVHGPSMFQVMDGSYRTCQSHTCRYLHVVRILADIDLLLPWLTRWAALLFIMNNDQWASYFASSTRPYSSIFWTYVSRTMQLSGQVTMRGGRRLAAAVHRHQLRAVPVKHP